MQGVSSFLYNKQYESKTTLRSICPSPTFSLWATTSSSRGSFTLLRANVCVTWRGLFNWLNELMHCPRKFRESQHCFLVVFFLEIVSSWIDKSFSYLCMISFGNLDLISSISSASSAVTDDGGTRWKVPSCDRIWHARESLHHSPIVDMRKKSSRRISF